MLAQQSILARAIEIVRLCNLRHVRLRTPADLPLAEDDMPAVVVDLGEEEVVRASTGAPAALEHLLELEVVIFVKAASDAHVRAGEIAQWLLTALEGASLAPVRARMTLRTIGRNEWLSEQELPGVRKVLTFEARYRTAEGAPDEII